MKEYIFKELGYFTESECKSIRNKMEGATYMKFHITWSNCAGNCTLIASTDYEDDAERIKSFFLHCLIVRSI